MALKGHLLPRCQGCDLESPLPIPQIHPLVKATPLCLYFQVPFNVPTKMFWKQNWSTQQLDGSLSCSLIHPPSIQSIIPSINQSHKTNIYIYIYMNIFMHVAKCNHHFATFCGSCWSLPGSARHRTKNSSSRNNMTREKKSEPSAAPNSKVSV